MTLTNIPISEQVIWVKSFPMWLKERWCYKLTDTFRRFGILHKKLFITTFSVLFVIIEPFFELLGRIYLDIRNSVKGKKDVEAGK